MPPIALALGRVPAMGRSEARKTPCIGRLGLDHYTSYQGPAQTDQVIHQPPKLQER